MQVRWWHIFVALTGVLCVAAACSGSPTATPPPTETPAPAGLTTITLREDSSLGGLSTNMKTTTIDAQTGAFVIEATNADPVEGAISAEDLATLAALIEETEFFSFDADYIPSDGTCCDLVAYIIAITRDGETYSVRASNENMPDGFRTLLGRIQALTVG